MDDNVEKNAPHQPAHDPAVYSRNESPIMNVFGKFRKIFSNRTTAIAGVLVLVLGVGAGIIAVQRSTEYRQQASVSTAATVQVATLGASTPRQTSNGLTSTRLDIPHTVVDGNHRLLVVSVSVRTSGETAKINSVKFDTFNLTKLASPKGTPVADQAHFTTEIWYLVNPPTGQKTVQIDLDPAAAGSITGVATNWTNVDTMNPFPGGYYSRKGFYENRYAATDPLVDKSFTFPTNDTQTGWTIKPGVKFVGIFSATGNTANNICDITSTQTDLVKARVANPSVILTSSSRPNDGSAFGYTVKKECGIDNYTNVPPGSGYPVSTGGHYVYYLTQVNGALERPSPCGTLGDVNEDGKITANDAKEILWHISFSAKPPINKYNAVNANVDGIGGVTGEDSAIILNYVAGTTTTPHFPACPATSTKKANGETCAGNADCQSGKCANAVCVAGGTAGERSYIAGCGAYGDVDGAGGNITQADVDLAKPLVGTSYNNTLSDAMRRLKANVNWNGTLTDAEMYTVTQQDIDILQRYVTNGNNQSEFTVCRYAKPLYTPTCKIGDIDNDDKITVMDGRIISAKVLQQETPGITQTTFDQRGDVDDYPDSTTSIKLTTRDDQAIRRYVQVGSPGVSTGLLDYSFRKCTTPATVEKNPPCNVPTGLAGAGSGYGDIDGNGKINTTDVNMIQNLTGYTAAQFERADVSDTLVRNSTNANITIDDVVQLDKFLTGDRTTFSVCSATGTGGSTAKPTVSITANNIDTTTSILPGGSATIKWTTTNADTCSTKADRNYEGWLTPFTTLSGSVSTRGLFTRTTYTTTCTNINGTTVDSVEVTIGADCDQGTCTACVALLNACGPAGKKTCTLTANISGTACTPRTTVDDCTGATRNCPAGKTCTTGATTCTPIVTPTLTPTVTSGATATLTSTPTTPACNATPDCGNAVCTPTTANTCNSPGSKQCTLTTRNGSTNCTPAVTTQTCTTPGTCTGSKVCSTNNVCVEPTGTQTGDTKLALSIGLDGIGVAKDNANRETTTGAQNQNPLRPTRNVIVDIYNATDNSLTTTKTGTITYESSSGLFKGEIALNTNWISKDYYIKIKSDGYLRARHPDTTPIASGATATFSRIDLIAGNVNKDHRISIADYDIIQSCDPLTNRSKDLCNSNPDYVILSDTNDDGIINGQDSLLLIRELSGEHEDN